jgi:NADH-quinone oxidoreductase subunit M
MLVPRNYRVIIRAIAVLATLISAVLAVKMFCQFVPGANGYQFEQQIPWVESLGISYHVGVDGLNVGLILMGAIVAFAATLCSWEIQTREKEFYILLLVMSGGILGAFASLDLFFFYFLHELALVPTFIMIGVWGRGERKNYATFQITLYLSIGALIALIGLIALYLQSGANTFDIPKIIEHAKNESAGGQRAEFHLPAAVVRLRHSGFALAVPFVGAAGLRRRAVADRHAPRRRAEKVRPLRFDPHRAAVDAAGAPTAG